MPPLISNPSHLSHSLVMRLKLTEVHVVEQYDAALDIRLAERPDVVEYGRIERRVIRVLGVKV